MRLPLSFAVACTHPARTCPPPPLSRPVPPLVVYVLALLVGARSTQEHPRVGSAESPRAAMAPWHRIRPPTRAAGGFPISGSMSSPARPWLLAAGSCRPRHGWLPQHGIGGQPSTATVSRHRHPSWLGPRPRTTLVSGALVSRDGVMAEFIDGNKEMKRMTCGLHMSLTIELNLRATI
jgi:hypothetical protein